MSKMNDLYITIRALLDEDYTPATIAFLLEIPHNWVYEVLNDGAPLPEPVDDKVLDEMARFYGEE